MELKKRIRIGDLLVDNKVISENQLQTALQEQKKTRRKLGKTLIDLGFIQESQLLTLLSKQLNIDYIELRQYQVDRETTRKLPEILARRFRALALKETNGRITVGMTDPTDIFAYDEIQKVLKTSVDIVAISETDLLDYIETAYRKSDEIGSLAGALDDQLAESDFDLSELSDQTTIEEAPVVKLLQAIFEDAVTINASDIHIEPDATVLRIRQRVDGVLQEQVVDEKRIATALTSRLKLMAGLNISEKRLPQDGRFNIRVKEKGIDVRLSTMPMVHGESVVMRLLDNSQGLLNFDKLGFPDDVLKPFLSLIYKSYGLILVTGPTGSGKTTSLYAALNEINTPTNKIITAEDPVEYQLPRINQVQIHAKIGLTFPSVLRTALRQDPDVILIGEMRDQETAEIGLRAAMTGHLVFSTLHTNDAISSISRLMDMGAEPFLVATSVQAVLAQRLVRRLCPECKTADDYDPQANKWLDQIDEGVSDTWSAYYKPVGCNSCNNTGYKGRIGVYELLVMNSELTNAIHDDDMTRFIKTAKQQKGFKTLAQGALELAMQGITTLSEVRRLAGDLDVKSVSN
jgi:MSHA biogenesis protein MshE